MDSLPIINKTYEAYKDIIELHTKLEKRWKYSLGIGLENSGHGQKCAKNSQIRLPTQRHGKTGNKYFETSPFT